MDLNIKKDLYELANKDYFVYPWFEDKTKPETYENWEFRKIKIRGNLTEDLFLVD